jgi:hypothetical protein
MRDGMEWTRMEWDTFTTPVGVTRCVAVTHAIIIRDLAAKSLFHWSPL